MVEASNFYQARGYRYHPVDWAVEKEYNEVTFQGKMHPVAGDLYFVGSAEQGFIKDYEILEPGTFYYAISPCVRPGDHNLSPLHRPYFLKLELFYKGKDDVDNIKGLEKIKTDATLFFSQFSNIEIRQKEGLDFDIEINGVEVGSYGLRKQGPYNFIYGTGLAEPRLSQALGRKDD